LRANPTQSEFWEGGYLQRALNSSDLKQNSGDESFDAFAGFAKYIKVICRITYDLVAKFFKDS
jgi:hypothetical protein